MAPYPPFGSGLVSLQEAVEMLSLTDKPEEEARRILEGKTEAQERFARQQEGLRQQQQ